MALTVKDIIKTAMRRANILASGEEPDASEAIDALATLRELIDHNSLSGALSHAQAIETYNLISGQRTYTWGIGGSFNAEPPEMVHEVWLNEEGGRDIPLTILGMDSFANSYLKDTTARPSTVWIDRGATIWNVYFPTIPYDPSVSFIVSKPLDSTQELTEVTAFPKGFDGAIAWELSIWLCAEYGRQPSPVQIGIAQKSMQILKRRWQRVPVARPEAGAGAGATDYRVEAGPF